jgi:hypothetical protein
VGVEWYDGIDGLAEPNCPVLALCLDNGRMQLMRYESDDNAVCIDTGIKPCKCKWNMNGTILAVAGFQLGGGGETMHRFRVEQEVEVSRQAGSEWSRHIEGSSGTGTGPSLRWLASSWAVEEEADARGACV